MIESAVASRFEYSTSIASQDNGGVLKSNVQVTGLVSTQSSLTH
jgi:hypothetical protein